MSLRDILSPHFHESSKDQSSYIKSLTAGKKGIAFLRAEVTSFRRQYSLHTHTHARNTTRSVKRFICFPTFISKMGGIVTFLCKRLDCAARVHLENATYVNNSFKNIWRFIPLTPEIVILLSGCNTCYCILVKRIWVYIKSASSGHCIFLFTHHFSVGQYIACY